MHWGGWGGGGVCEDGEEVQEKGEGLKKCGVEKNYHYNGKEAIVDAKESESFVCASTKLNISFCVGVLKLPIYFLLRIV